MRTAVVLIVIAMRVIELGLLGCIAFGSYIFVEYCI
jgi:hypothetical protein